MYRFGVRARLNLAMGVVAGILAIVAVDALYNIRQLVSTSDDVARTQETRAALQALLADVTSAESGQRGYIITGDSSFLANLEEDRARVWQGLRDLRSLVAEHAEQTARLDSLEPALTRRFEILDRNAALRSQRGLEAAAAAIRSHADRVLSDSIRSLVERMDQSEVEELAPGLARARAGASRAIAVTMVGLIAAIISYLGLSAFVRRAIERQRAAEAAHLAATRHYESVVGVLAEGIVIQDASGKVVDCNPAAELILGLPRATILRLADADFDWNGVRENGEPFPKEEHPALLTLRTGLPARNVIMGVQRHRLGRRWLLINSTPLRDPVTNRLTGVVSSFSDITRRREAEERLRDVLDNAAEMIVTTDGEGTILYANTAFCEVMGYPDQADVLGRSIVTMVAPPYRDVARADFERLRRGETVGGECGLVSRDGRQVVVSRNANGRLENGKLLTVRMFLRDITAQKEVERRLEMQYAVSRIIAESATIERGGPRLLEAIAVALDWHVAGMWLHDEERDAMRMVAHWSRDPNTAGPFISKSLEMSFSRRVGLVGRVWASGEPEWLDRIVMADSAPRASEALAAGLHAAFAFPLAADGQTIGVIEVLTTEPRPPNPALLALMTSTGRQIGQFVARVRAQAEAVRAREAAEQASRAKSEFLANISHELRTPLNSVIGFASVLLRNRAGNLTPQDLQFLERIHDNGRHLLGLINGILDLAKVESGKLELELCEVHLDQLVAETLGQLQGQVRDRPVELRSEVPAGLEPIRADSQKLKQVLINLVGNALKFTEQGSVTLRVAADPVSRRPVRIDVVDTGIGIPKERQQAVFEAFQQADNTTSRKYGGTGLGLAITRSLLHLMGYHITLESEVGKGSVFSVHLAPPEQNAA
ncbi:MAG TPA: CHASE3 domain-containing protein [Gemmatimonadales bacterium]|nr:CHASE3 domain-containing protein [Gemmatimonadales bacterium]